MEEKKKNDFDEYNSSLNIFIREYDNAMDY